MCATYLSLYPVVLVKQPCFPHRITAMLTLRRTSQAVPVCLLLAGRVSVAAVLRGLICWCFAWAALLAAGSIAWAARLGADNADWIEGTYGFMLVRRAQSRKENGFSLSGTAR